MNALMNLFFIGVIFNMNFVLRFVVCCILISVFVGRYIEYIKMNGVSNMKFANTQQAKVA